MTPKKLLKVSNIEKYSKLYVKDLNHKGGSRVKTFLKLKSIKSREKDDVNVVKFDITDQSNQILKSYFLKLYYYDNPTIIENILKINRILKNKNITKFEEDDYIKKLEISDKDVGKGYYEIMFYKKFYNLIKKTKINIIKPVQYGFFNYLNLNEKIILENNITLSIREFFNSNEIVNNLNYNGSNYYSYLITEYNPDLITLDAFSHTIKPISFAKNINPVLNKILELLNTAYYKFKFIHCDLHWNNILINKKLNIRDIQNNDIMFFDFDLSQIGGFKDVGLLYNLTNDSVYNMNRILNFLKIPMKYPNVYRNTVPYTSDDIVNFKKNEIYCEIFHAFDYFRLLYEIKFYDKIDWNIVNGYKSATYKLSNFVLDVPLLKHNIIKDFDVRDSNLLYKINSDLVDYNSIYDNFNIKLLVAVYLYIKINPKTILNKYILESINPIQNKLPSISTKLPYVSTKLSSASTKLPSISQNRLVKSYNSKSLNFTPKPHETTLPTIKKTRTNKTAINNKTTKTNRTENTSIYRNFLPYL